MKKVVIQYKPLPPKKRLEDVSQTAEGWTFTTHEHDEMNFPRLIRATDAKGRSCFYSAELPDGQTVDIKKVESSSDRPRRVDGCLALREPSRLFGRKRRGELG
jgi:hypothetical protein